MSRLLAAALVSLLTLAGIACKDVTRPLAAAKLAFGAQPQSVIAGPARRIVVRVLVQDAQGSTVTSATDDITVALSAGTGTPGATLSGTCTRAAVAGVADFTDLAIDKLGTRYTLSASAGGLAGATSFTFAVRPAAVTVTPSTPEPIAGGTSLQFTAEARDAAAGVIADPGITWQSSDITVLQISPSGRATAVGLGSAWITATVADVESRTPLTTFDLPVSVEVTPAGATLIAAGATLQLTATARRAGGSAMAGQVFTWATDDPTRVRVSPTGLVTAVAPGTATVWAAAHGVPGGTTVSVRPTTTLPHRIDMGIWDSWALTPSGVAYGWGQILWTNWDAVIRSTPAPLDGGLLFWSVSAGGHGTCGIDGRGDAYCWGGNLNGELGDGTRAPHHDPALVSGGLTLQSIDVGDQHVCGVTLDGAAYCWGDNASGQLGDGTNSGRLVPVPVMTAVNFQYVAAGASHTCGLTPSGAAYCWGRNANGQLGDGTTADRLSPVPVAGGLTFRAISLGASHTCGVTNGGGAYCWGANAFGQLGDSTTTDRSSPVAVGGGVAFESVTVGVRNSCALGVSGAAYCWGGNPLQLDQIQLRPALVPGGLVFTTLSAGGYHTCGLTANGAAHCWGYNSDGQLGDVTSGIVFGTPRALPESPGAPSVR